MTSGDDGVAAGIVVDESEAKLLNDQETASLPFAVLKKAVESRSESTLTFLPVAAVTVNCS
jgi:hypothetical protein